MPWPPVALLGFRDTTRSLGRYPGDSVFVMLGLCTITGHPILLGSDGRKAIIPAYYLVPMPEGAQEAAGAPPVGR